MPIWHCCQNMSNISEYELTLVLIFFPATCWHSPLRWDIQLSLPRQGAGTSHPMRARCQQGQQLFHLQVAQDTRILYLRKPQYAIKDLITKELFAFQSGSMQLSPNTREACRPHPFRASENRWKPQHGRGMLAGVAYSHPDTCIHHGAPAALNSGWSTWLIATTLRARIFFIFILAKPQQVYILRPQGPGLMPLPKTPWKAQHPLSTERTGSADAKTPG